MAVNTGGVFSAHDFDRRHSKTRLCRRSAPTVLGVLGVCVFVGVPLVPSAGAAGRWASGGSTVNLLATLHDPGASANDYFGGALAVSGDTAIVGAGGTKPSGVAYIYSKGTSGWPTTPTVTLQDPAAVSGDGFGAVVGVSGSTAIVGAGNLTTNTLYLYVKDSSGWPTAPTVTMHDPHPGDDVPTSVAVSGTTVVVGAFGNNRAGVAYIYVKGTSGWPTTPTVTLHDPAANVNDLYGGDVAVSGTTVVVGAADTRSDFGAAYIYVKGTSGWPTKPSTALRDPGKNAQSGDQFGISVSVAGTTALVGANQANSFTGASYIYHRGTAWPTTPTAVLRDPSSAGSDFGRSVGVSPTVAAVGTCFCFQTPQPPDVSFIYVKGTSGWPTKPSATLHDPGADANDNFGFPGAVWQTTALIGAPGTNSNAGAAYIYSV